MGNENKNNENQRHRSKRKKQSCFNLLHISGAGGDSNIPNNVGDGFSRVGQFKFVAVFLNKGS